MAKHDESQPYQPFRHLGPLNAPPAPPEPEPVFGSTAWIARNSSAASRQFCRHGLSDNTVITAVDVVEGGKATVTIYHYQCLDHLRFGIFSVTKPKKL